MVRYGNVSAERDALVAGERARFLRPGMLVALQSGGARIPQAACGADAVLRHGNRLSRSGCTGERARHRTCAPRHIRDVSGVLGDGLFLDDWKIRAVRTGL